MTVPRWVRASLVLVSFFVGVLVFLVWNNPAPSVPAVSAEGPATARNPYVIKLHARWCPVCMVTKDEWANVQAAYQGRVRFVVFDFTTEATAERSRTEAKRIGLDPIFDEYVGETGTVLVLDGVTREVTNSLHGNLALAEYQAAIDAALRLR